MRFGPWLVGAVAAAQECVDASADCKTWAEEGECDKNEHYMKLNCPRSCDSCAYSQNFCSRRRKGPAWQGQNALDDVFKKIANLPKAKVWSNDPWVVTVDDFLADTETDAFLETTDHLFERSKAGDQISTARTSDQAWCQKEPCLTDMRVRQVHARIINLTSVPVENAEYFQIVRYKPGQYYRQHHDQNTPPDSLSGVRLMTFFMYLREPEEGGETGFPSLKIKVEPKKGRALVWPNVLGKNLRDSDFRTTHEGTPPKAGVKFSANVWLHQYDFRTFNSRGCDMGLSTLHGPQVVPQPLERWIADQAASPSTEMPYLQEEL